ncbi:hypothetical protein [Pararobbsia alpina]|uniref:hypothetical protein n=1 Tax=Pararobbsia alpina TaxID=621374 RepID=UPI001582DB64|nr:hypothetical protein [Pararobbsia alpina]
MGFSRFFSHIRAIPYSHANPDAIAMKLLTQLPYNSDQYSVTKIPLLHPRSSRRARPRRAGVPQPLFYFAKDWFTLNDIAQKVSSG